MNGAQHALSMFLQNICLFLLLLWTVKGQNVVREIVCFLKKIIIIIVVAVDLLHVHLESSAVAENEALAKSTRGLK